jgi:hypothetical protein
VCAASQDDADLFIEKKLFFSALEYAECNDAMNDLCSYVPGQPSSDWVRITGCVRYCEFKYWEHYQRAARLSECATDEDCNGGSTYNASAVENTLLCCSDMRAWLTKTCYLEGEK